MPKKIVSIITILCASLKFFLGSEIKTKGQGRDVDPSSFCMFNLISKLKYFQLITFKKILNLAWKLFLKTVFYLKSRKQFSNLQNKSNIFFVETNSLRICYENMLILK